MSGLQPHRDFDKIELLYWLSLGCGEPMTENQTLADEISATTERARSTLRGHKIAVLLLALAVVGITLIISHIDEIRTAHETLIAGEKYEAGMHALKGDRDPRDLEQARELFTEAAIGGDARGNFGLACIIYQQGFSSLETANPAARSIKMEVVFSNLAHAANNGSYPAQAALVSYYPWESEEESDRLVLNLLKGAITAALFTWGDPAFPKGAFRMDPRSYVRKMLKQEWCGPALSDEDINIVINRALAKAGKGR
jgi:hypothetical protein